MPKWLTILIEFIEYSIKKILKWLFFLGIFIAGFMYWIYWLIETRRWHPF